jgi:TfoX/Sxy family transcriptional regulator of competence genes
MRKAVMRKAKLVRSKKRKPAQPKSRNMPEFTKPPSALVELFQAAVADMADVRSRQMFGYPAAFTKTQMFASLFQDKMILRLSSADRETLGREGARPFEPMPGRPMREYVVVPEVIRDSPSRLGKWLVKAQGYAASLPPKKK